MNTQVIAKPGFTVSKAYGLCGTLALATALLIVEAEYNVTKLDGSDFERTEREGSFKNGIEALMELLTN